MSEVQQPVQVRELVTTLGEGESQWQTCALWLRKVLDAALGNNAGYPKKCFPEDVLALDAEELVATAERNSSQLDSRAQQDLGMAVSYVRSVISSKRLAHAE
ncbi:MAG: hypothetical protein V1760_03730 [Candidatus Peregrinibacteria bacterium]